MNLHFTRAFLIELLSTFLLSINNVIAQDGVMDKSRIW